MRLDSSVSRLKGVGPVVKSGLDRLKIETVEDLLYYFPRRWEDYSQVYKIADIKPGLVTVKARVERVNLRRAFRRKLTIVEAILSDDSGTIKAVWFNQPYLIQTLKEGQEYFFAGKFEFKSNNLSLQAPSFEVAPVQTSSSGGRIVPIYPETSSINSKIIAKLVDQVIDLVTELNDDLPTDIMGHQNLISHTAAIRQIHQPTTPTELESAKQRLGFEELFYLILTGLVIKREIQTEPSVKIPFVLKNAKAFLKAISFELTAGQKRAAWTIFSDLEKDGAMNRLLEGDVGSGKTAVALMASYMAIKAGYQVALMVPTEVLARQHFITIQRLFAKLDLQVDLLVAALKPAAKRQVHDRLTTGRTNLVIGTHALLSEKVDFAKLGLVVIDEQHRFGVNQRRTIRAKSSFMPHLLSMTATPIPRSLALVIYGDLDLSVITDMPPGRQPVATKLAAETEREKVYGQVDRLIDQGQQVFVVCPLIDDSEEMAAKSVTAEHAKLSKTIFAHRRIGLVHGRLKSAEKETVMAKFATGELDILIATSVIEVGIDVPNATVIIIEGADRFGLAALHQLRGRVGRSGLQSHCYLFTDSDQPATLDRLRALERSQDGFRLAQIDLETRGPGEIYGHRQHGELDLRMASILDLELIQVVKREAESFLSSQNLLEYERLTNRINQLKKVTTLD